MFASQSPKILLRLLWPTPWHFRVPTQLSPAELQIATDETYSLRQAGILQLFHIPLFRVRDTPLCSLYRLYEDLCSNNIVMLSYESEYFFYHTETAWQLSRIPDPQDADPVRYALLASFVEALIASFNWKLELGLRRDGTQREEEEAVHNVILETPPDWTSRVKPLTENLNLRVGGRDESDPFFSKRNIEAPMGYLYSV